MGRPVYRVSSKAACWYAEGYGSGSRSKATGWICHVEPTTAESVTPKLVPTPLNSITNNHKILPETLCDAASVPIYNAYLCKRFI